MGERSLMEEERERERGRWEGVGEGGREGEKESIGDACPLNTERGYHVSFPPDPSKWFNRRMLFFRCFLQALSRVVDLLGDYAPLDPERGYHVSFPPGLPLP